MGKQFKPRSLRLLFIWLLVLSLSFFIIIFISIFNASMPKMLENAENQYLNKQMDVVGGVLESSRSKLFLLAEDTAIWEETFQYVMGRNPSFFRDNWPATSLIEAFNLNFVIFKDNKNNDLFLEFYNQQTGKKLEQPEGLSAFLNTLAREVLENYRHAPENSFRPAAFGKAGLIIYDSRAYSIAVMPVVPSLDSPTPGGVLIFGNLLDNSYLKDLTHYPDVDFEISPLENPPAGARAEGSISHKEDNLISSSMLLEDIDGKPLLLKMTAQRPIYKLGKEALDRSSLLLTVAMVLFTGMIFFIVNKLVLKPLARLSADMSHLSGNELIDSRKYSTSSEFAQLGNAINGMLNNLNQSRVSIKTTQRILNEMNAFVYVSDMQTDELLFANDKMLKELGLKEVPVGSSCWEIIHQNEKNKRCSHCPRAKLWGKEHGQVSWEEQDPKSGRHYRNTSCLIEWSNGKLVHLHHRVDITDIKVAEASLQKRLDQQELMTALSQSFISTEVISSLINNALRMVGEFMDVSKIVLATVQGNYLEGTYVWHNEKHKVPATMELKIPFRPGCVEYDAYISDRLSFLAFNDLSGLSGFKLAHSLGVHALISVPIFVNNEFWGMLSINESRGCRSWSASDVQLIKLIGVVIAGALTRSSTEAELVRLSSIVNSSPQFISFINKDGVFEYLNPGTLPCLGYSPEELEGNSLFQVLDYETYTWFKDKMIPEVVERGQGEYELSMFRKDGSERIMSLSASVAGESSEAGIGIIALDITEKRRLERDLIKAKEQAESSNRAKSEFLSRMSHEMRTPLNAIIGMASIARNASEMKKKEYCLSKIDDASAHLLGVINDILDMSKIEASKFELSCSDFVFEKMLMRIVSVVNFRVDEKKQNLIVHIDPSVPYSIIADEQRLAQVVTNLLSNAVKFTPESGSITLSAKVDEENGEECVLRVDVQDSGIGISREQQARLFRPFEQADGGISRKFGGTGLGLAISRKIIELMDGNIWIDESTPAGSRFTFRVKVKKGNQSTTCLRHDLDWGSVRILVVDDAPEVRSYFSEFSSKMGIACAVAADGAEAFELIQSNSGKNFNVIFVDWKVPDMDGIELARKLKERDEADVVVIMISAAQWNDVESEAKEAGVSRFLPKPLFSSEIMDCITESLTSSCLCVKAVKPEESEEGCFAGYNVLLAEDVDINREIVEALLEHTGVKIYNAENGQQAFDMFRRQPGFYDMIFMDIHMPEMDGYEATQRIRSLGTPEAATVPIVAMTANVFKEDINRCLSIGMNSHIGKPININEIVAEMKRFLKAKN